jgi:hypothetical protein
MRAGWEWLAGLLVGAGAGALWGFWGGDGYEAGDSAIGTGLMGAIAGLAVGATVTAVRFTRARHRAHRPEDR